MGFSLVEGVTALGEVDYRAFGLEGFGNPDNYLGRQVSRWRSQLESYGEYPSWPGPKRIPGDYHFGNVICRHDGPELAAIVDWELTTIGDPLMDLGWLLATWPSAAGATIESLRVEPWERLPVQHGASRALPGPQPS